MRDTFAAFLRVSRLPLDFLPSLRSETFLESAKILFEPIKSYLVATCVKMRQQFPVDEIFCVVYNQIHNRFRHHIKCRLYDNFHVGIDQVADGFHLSFQLRIQRTLSFLATFLQTSNPDLG